MMLRQLPHLRTHAANSVGKDPSCVPSCDPSQDADRSRTRIGRGALLKSTLLCCSLVWAGCSSPPKEEEAANGDKPNPIYSQPTVTVGDGNEETLMNTVFLQLDHALTQWNKLYMTASKPIDQHRAVKLAEDISHKATRYQHDLIQELEAGSPQRRQIAALALGFSEVRSLPSDSRDPKRGQRVSPIPHLLAALNDPVPGVVSNALTGLAMQAERGMASGRIIELLDQSEDVNIRRSAAWALNKLSQAKAELPGVNPVARRALTDSEPGVRTQAALILASRLDGEAISGLASLLRDEKNLPAVAAARSLAYIGSREIRMKGSCARALVGGLGQVRPEVQTAIISNLMALSDRNYGEDEPEEWLRWANSIP